MLLILANLLLIITALFFLFRSFDFERSVYRYAVLITFIAGISVGLFYKLYYDRDGDTYTLFDSAVRVSKAAKEDPKLFVQFFIGHGLDNANEWAKITGNHNARAVFMMKWLIILVFMTGGNYWLCSLWMSLLSFAGKWMLIHFLHKLFRKRISAWVWVLSFLLWPSVLFWSSGILKESLLWWLTGLLISLYFLLSRADKFNGLYIMKAFLFLLTSYWLFRLKYHCFMLIIPFLLTDYIVHFFEKKKLRKTWIIPSGIVFLLTFLISGQFLHPNLALDFLPEAIVRNHDVMKSDAGISTLHTEFDNLEGTYFSLLKNAPQALLSGFQRPFLWEALTWPQGIAGLENLCIFILIMSIHYEKIPATFRKLNFEEKRLVLLALGFVLISAVLFPLTTPNLGTLHRYRVFYLPFFLVSVLSVNRFLKS